MTYEVYIQTSYYGTFIILFTSFVLLLFVLLLAIAKILPFGPLRDAVVLRLAASFLTDWFGWDSGSVLTNLVASAIDCATSVPIVIPRCGV